MADRMQSNPQTVPMRRVQDVPSTVWTQSALLRWAPELRFYEHRAAILRDMKDAGLLTAFRIGDDEAGAQIGDGQHEVEFSHRHLEVMIGSREGDIDDLLKAVTIVLDQLRPESPARASFTFQHVASLAVDYDEARRSALSSLFGSPDLGPVVLSDFANLVDVVSADPAATATVEYGIVSRDELPTRLSREYGRAMAPTRRRMPRAARDPSKLPAVAFFMEAAWMLADRIADDNPLDEFKETWDACRNASDDLAEALRHHLFGPLNESEEQLQ